MNTTGKSEPCESCGAVVPGGTEGCKAMFNDILTLEFSDYRYSRVHRVTVDAYSLQHPKQYMKSFKSHAAHLTGLCWALEYDRRPAIGKALKRWLDGKLVKPKVAEPEFKGSVTIADVIGANSPKEQSEKVMLWAKSAWEAWSEHHETIRVWLKTVARL